MFNDKINMFSEELLFAAALQIQEPLYVEKVEFLKDEGELHMYVDFRKGARFRCSVCGTEGLSIHDTIEKTWRHLNFFQYKAFIHYRTPRTECSEHGVHLVDVPWGGSNSGFTLLFEAFILQLAKCMPISQIAKLVDEHDTKLWRIVGKYVNAALKVADYSDMERVGLDETSSKKGHNYVTIFVDMDETKAVYVTEGKDASTIAKFKEELPLHNCKPQQITDISCDMSPAFKKGLANNFSWSNITFDKFHVIKLMNEALDKVRREEQKNDPELKYTRYIWLYNAEKLSISKTRKLASLRNSNKKTAKAYQLKLNLQDIYKSANNKVDAMIMLEKWYSWAVRCRLEPVKAFAKTMRNNWSGILNYFDSNMTNATLEGMNSIVQAARARARGYRNVNNFITIIYLLAGKLNINFQFYKQFYQNYGQPKLPLPT